MNVINTLKPNSIVKAIKTLKQQNLKKKQIKENPIAITKHYLKLLKDFEPMGTNNKIQGLGRLTN